MRDQSNQTITIFIVEDDRLYSEILHYRLSLNPNYAVHIFADAASALANLELNPSIICVDYSLPDMTGAALLQKLYKHNPQLPAIVISGLEDVRLAVDLVKEPNVVDYLVKDDHTVNRLWELMSRLQEELLQASTVAPEARQYDKLLKGESKQIQDVYRLLDKACKNTITVSVTGPTGTGKELVARCVHEFSTRKAQPFVAVNMSAIPADLAESELFGHEKGAFTGAQSRRIGKFEEAHRGTLFLDEIAEMDASLQAKLLRVLQEREVVRLGANKPVAIDVRLVVATHKNLEEEVRKGNFREDLYYRLLGLQIKLPALQERKDDILPLATHFIASFAKQNKQTAKALAPAATERLLKYPWPGNIRELKAVLELAMVMADGPEITADDLMLNQEARVEELIGQEDTLRGYTSKIIRHYLDQYDQNIALVANKLDIGKSTLYRMLKNEEV